MEFAELKYAQGGAPVYMYLFAREMPINGGMVAWHGTEIDFAFHYADYSPARWLPNGDTERIQDEMCACWTSFARTGNPNNPLVPYLPPTTPEKYATIVWDRDTTVRINHDRSLVGLLPVLELPNDARGYANG